MIAEANATEDRRKLTSCLRRCGQPRLPVGAVAQENFDKLMMRANEGFWTHQEGAQLPIITLG